MDEGITGEDDLLTYAEVARRAGVSRYAVRNWWQAGKLPGYRLGHRTIRFKRVDVEAFIASRRVEAR